MSVLSCNRNGCENIMRDRLSYKYGYICDECFEELCASGIHDIEYFMSSFKSDSFEPPNDRKVFENEFLLNL